MKLSAELIENARATRSYRAALWLGTGAQVVGGGALLVSTVAGSASDHEVTVLFAAYVAVVLTCFVLIRVAGIPWRGFYRFFRGLDDPRRTERAALYKLAGEATTVEEARTLARAGLRIQAVKVVRRVTGASLIDALAAVKQMEKDG